MLRRPFLASALLLAGSAFAQANLATYEGPDRLERIVAAAKKEGQLTLYTTIAEKDLPALIKPFEAKYGIKVNVWRSSSEKVLQRAVTEARGNRHTVDIIETNGPEMEAMYREKLLAEFHSPHFKDLPPAAFPKHRQWVADRFNFFTIGYNTNLVKPDEVPNSYEDLLHTRFAGKLALEASDTDWFGAIVKHMGEAKGLAFFRKLAAAKPQMRNGHTLLAELVSSGEVPITATIYNHNIERLAVRGAPVKWKALAPTFGRPNAIGVVVVVSYGHFRVSPPYSSTTNTMRVDRARNCSSNSMPLSVSGTNTGDTTWLYQGSPTCSDKPIKVGRWITPTTSSKPPRHTGYHECPPWRACSRAWAQPCPVSNH